MFRGVDKLVRDTPVGLQLARTGSCGVEKRRAVDLALVDTAVAYEHVIERLKCIVELPLRTQLVDLLTQKGSTSAMDDFVIFQGLIAVIETCKESAEESTSLPRPVCPILKAKLTELFQAADAAASDDVVVRTLEGYQRPVRDMVSIGRA
ncbi:hypothetical protein E4U43_003517 [Claviceps pusilla]|uniref:Uncharacterized protein n=1 Tax=Claviceps pusilla TaxID=123648 RepID=A0A9P7N4M1_9HYPO|nr:hypothetical protein E4U43_003517 [Claviceps pusilla]